jgi:hypothetical protein
VFSILFSLAVFILTVAALWEIFEKAGKPGWAAIILIYNVLVLSEIVGKPWWYLLLCLIPGVNVVIGIWMINLLSLSFGRSTGFTIGLIFLSFIFFPILGFGGNQYKGPAGQATA